MSFKNESSVYTYLNQIDNGPLLTRKQEEDLIKNIEVYQKQILEACIKSKYSRNELKTYLASLDSSGESIIDVSRKLDDESSTSEVEAMGIKFKQLMGDLNNDQLDNLETLLDEVALSGTIVHAVVTEIKKRHSSITDVESKVRQVSKYMPNLTVVDVLNKVENDNDFLVLLLKKEYGLSDIKAQNKINEWKHVIEEYRNVEVTLGKSFSFDEVKVSYKAIANLEVMASKFKNELITKNLRLVVSRAKNFVNRGLDFEDLIQEGNIGLMKAIDKFDSSKKTKVSTYATWWIDQSIRRAISNKGKTVRVPTHIEWMQLKLSDLTKKMTAELQRPPTLRELSERSGYDLKQLEDLQTRAQHEIGLEEELNSGLSMMDLLPSEDEGPSSVVEKKILREKVRDILSTLPPRTEKIIRLRFGIGEAPDSEGTTLQTIADQIGITKQGVRVVECSAFKMLRKKARVLAGE